MTLFLLCSSIAAAQQPSGNRSELTGIQVSDQPATEVQIQLSTTIPVASPEVVGTYRDSLVLELPGTVYRALPRRIRVGRAGIKAVRVWMQSEHPASTRVLVEIERTEQYTVTSDGTTVVLRVGPALAPVGSAEIHDTAEVFGRHTPAAAARGGASASLGGALTGIFHRGASKPVIYKGPSLKASASTADATAGANTAAAPATQSSTQTPASSTAADKSAATPESGAGEVANNLPPTGAGAAAESPSSGSSASIAPALSEQPTVSIDVGTSTSPSTTSPSNPSSSDLPAAISTSPPSVVAPAGITLPSASGSATDSAGAASEAQPEPAPERASVPAATSASTVAASIRPAPPMANPGIRTEFHVKFVEADSAYIDGGRSAGLAEGMKLLVKDVRGAGGSRAGDGNAGVAELVVVGVAETSAVTEIHNPKRDVVAGDVAFLSSGSVEALVQQQAVSATRNYPAVITFSEGGDALDEEAHAFVPKPPLPSVNRAAGRIGFDYIRTTSTDASQLTSLSYGAVVRVDYTRIGGTYWDLRGYWRGNFTSNSVASQQTLQDLLNRTYHLALTYDDPNSTWVMGVGRMYLPWAVSLQTIDGGYFGARLGHGTTFGVFGGSTPDPTSWNYNPDRHLGGSFFNATGGTFDGFHYSSTLGAGEEFQSIQYSTTTTTGTTTSSYQDNRPFAFLENSISYSRRFSVFEAVQVDRPSGNPVVASPGTGLSSSFLTVRVEPVSRVELTANDTYFRDVPTFDPQLIGTGLLDKYLFQGWSGGVRIEPIKQIFLYTELGRSSRTGDTSASLNQLYGITFGELPKLKLRADVHYSKFSSSFGSGIYRAFSLSRSIGDHFHFEVLGGDQDFTSPLAGNQNARFVTTNIDTSLGTFLFLQAGFTAYRGQLQNYNQSYVIIGYQFDSKWKRKR